MDVVSYNIFKVYGEMRPAKMSALSVLFCFVLYPWNVKKTVLYI